MISRAPADLAPRSTAPPRARLPKAPLWERGREKTFLKSPQRAGFRAEKGHFLRKAHSGNEKPSQGNHFPSPCREETSQGNRFPGLGQEESGQGDRFPSQGIGEASEGISSQVREMKKQVRDSGGPVEARVPEAREIMAKAGETDFQVCPTTTPAALRPPFGALELVKKERCFPASCR